MITSYPYICLSHPPILWFFSVNLAFWNKFLKRSFQKMKNTYWYVQSSKVWKSFMKISDAFALCKLLPLSFYRDSLRVSKLHSLKSGTLWDCKKKRKPKNSANVLFSSLRNESLHCAWSDSETKALFFCRHLEFRWDYLRNSDWKTFSKGNQLTAR